MQTKSPGAADSSTQATSLEAQTPQHTDPKNGQTKKHRNTASMVRLSEPYLAQAVSSHLMHVTIQDRKDKKVVLPTGQEVVEFINCSYLGLDLHPDVIAGAQQTVEEWGVHFCCARSRFSIQPHQLLEEGLSALFRGRAITFPTVTAAHMSVLPLLASGVLFEEGSSKTGKVRMVFDRFAHASMQYLKPILATEAQVTSIPHNDLDALRQEVLDARAQGQRVVYLADGVYSMGGLCPVRELLALSEELDFTLYIDDAHGTSIFGEHGEGYVMSQIEGPLPSRMMVNFSLAKGFGCNGGGIVLPSSRVEKLVRYYGQTYMFSAPLDFSLIGAALASLKLHQDGTVRRLQQTLQDNIALFLYGDAEKHEAQDREEQHAFLDRFATGQYYKERTDELLSPICMLAAGTPENAIALGDQLVHKGFFLTTAFFPVVPRARSQLRIAITTSHTPAQLLGLREALHTLPSPA